jgi:tetratricopeptide (TPR) repeat protein
MKYLLILLAIITNNLKAQTLLKFDKRFVESEDKWVAFDKGKDSIYTYGFIYIDEQAGLTLNFEGEFSITKEGVFVPKKKLDSTSVKLRLQPNHVLVAFIPETKFDELKIQAVPEWLSSYKADTNSVRRLYRWGFMYNAWDQPAKALTYLERGQKIDPKFKGLEFELAYAYNALQQYDKAIIVLKSAIETSPKDCYLYKELSYAEFHTGQLEKASATGKQGISFCTDRSIKAEIAYNLAYQYYKAEDKINFKYWADETKKWATNGDQFMNSVNKLEAALMK